MKERIEVREIRTSKPLELPLNMLVPIVVLGLGILVLGIFNESIVTQILQYAIPGGGF